MTQKLPRWLVWSEDMGEMLDSAETVIAATASDAAHKYAEDSYNGEPWDGEMAVSVRPLRGGDVCEFTVEPVQTLAFDVRPA